MHFCIPRSEALHLMKDHSICNISYWPRVLYSQSSNSFGWDYFQHKDEVSNRQRLDNASKAKVEDKEGQKKLGQINNKHNLECSMECPGTIYIYQSICFIVCG